MSIYLETEYVPVNCGPESKGGCNLPFAMTRAFYDLTKRTGQTWYCPNGHPRMWKGKTTEDQLRDAQAKLTATEDQLRAATEDAERTRVALLRDRQRFANGVCPCCNRTFANVRRHMETKHPDYDPSDAARPLVFRCSCGRTFDSLRGLRTHQGHQRHDDWYRPGKRWGAHLTEVTP